jgi:tRNA modification GTPase
MTPNKTIAAIATPPGIGALAIIRMSGADAFKIAASVFFEKQKFQQSKPRFLRQYLVFDCNTQEIIDEVTAVKYPAPATYTGEDLIEIISHGGTLTVKKIMNLLLLSGAVIADRGEFSKRAFINGKIDLMKAEAINAIIESKSEKEYVCAVNSYTGVYKKLSEWYEIIQEEISYCDAEIEFGEEESISPKSPETINRILISIQDEIGRIQKFKEVKNGINVVLAGPANSGKSTLFNYLLGYKRSIVHEQPGTTRDSISANVTIDGNDIILFDTAGIRTTSDQIENEGISISRNLIDSAQLVLWVTDCSMNPDLEEIETLNQLDRDTIILIFNKTDIGINDKKASFFLNSSIKTIQISVKNRINLLPLMTLISDKIKTLYSEIKPPDIFINDRHQNIAINIESNLQKALTNWQQKEIASHFLRESLCFFEEIFGKTDNETIINNIFTKFCIGK